MSPAAAPDPKQPPSTTAPPWRALAAFMPAFFLAAMLGHALTLDAAAQVASFWPPAGLYLAALLLTPARHWPWLVGAAMGANLAADLGMLARPLLPTIGFALANTTEAITGALLVRRLAPRDGRALRLERPRDLLALGAAALLAPAAGASVAIATLFVLSSGAPLVDIWQRWWAADLLGIGLVTPLVLHACRRDRRAGSEAVARSLSPEVLASTAALAASAALAFWLPPPAPPLSFVALPALLWVALRFGSRGATMGAALLAIVAVSGTVADRGVFAMSSLLPADRAVLLQLYLAISTATAHAFAALQFARRQATRALAEANAALERRVETRTADLARANDELGRVNGTLAAREARLRVLFEASPTPAYVVEPESLQIVDCNDAAARMLGYSRAELRRLRLTDVDAALAAEDMIGATRNRATGAIGEFATRHRKRDGELRDVLVVSVPVEIDGQRLSYSVVLDITERRRAEAAMEQSGERLQLALDAGRMGIFAWDLVEDRLEWDARQYELFGIEASSGPIDGQDALSRVHPDDRPGLEAAIGAAVAAGDGAFSHEFRVVLNDGAVRWIGGYGYAVPDASGRAVRMVGLNYDVTERRAAQDALRELADTLETRVRQEVEAREAAQARAQHGERLQALGQLAGGIAHDFNNVLQTVQGAAALIERRAGDAAVAKRFGRMILDATTRGEAVTRRLLAFARRDELRADAIEPASLLDELRDVLAHTLGASIEVRLKLEPGVPPLMADRGQLETVLVNLATNARDAMPEGGRLTMCASEDTVAPGTGPHPAGLAPGRYVRIEVADTGSGIDPLTLTKVLEPFFTTKPAGQGTGLGLSMAKGFAEQSGGGLSIESTPRRGTTVALWLPVASDPSPMLADEAAKTTATARTHRVLVVDDELLVRETVVAQLQDAGFDVQAASSGAEALELLDEGARPELLVTDLAMPAMSGLALMREARRRRPGLPVLLLTGYAGEAARLVQDANVDMAGFALLRKPVGERELVDRALELAAGGAVTR